MIAENNKKSIYIAEDYKKLRELKEKQDITITELNAEIEKIKQNAQERESKIKEILYDRIDKREAELKEKDKVIQTQDQEIQALKAENNEIKAQKHTLTQEQIQEIINQARAQKEAEIEKIKKEAREREAQKNQEIQTLKTKNTELKNEKERFHELLEQNLALKEAYNHALEALKNREKTPNNEELTENLAKQAKFCLDNIIKDDEPLCQNNTAKINDELGIDKILINKNEAQEQNKPKIRKYR